MLWENWEGRKKIPKFKSQPSISYWDLLFGIWDFFEYVYSPYFLSFLCTIEYTQAVSWQFPRTPCAL